MLKSGNKYWGECKMDGGLRRRVPIYATEAFSNAADEMIFNQAAVWIKQDPQANDVLGAALREMGQYRFINMTSGMMDSRISLVLYAGNGNVVKIMPDNYQGGEYVFQMPPVSQTKVGTSDRNYLIKTYPYVASHRTMTREDVEMLRRQAGILGQEFNPGDDTPGNLKNLPDAEGTLFSIDDDTFTMAHGGLNYGPELLVAWKNYIAELFPVYKEGKIPAQTANTNFEYVMNYNREARLSRFDPLAPSPIVYKAADGAPTSQRRSFWEIITKLHHD